MPHNDLLNKNCLAYNISISSLLKDIVRPLFEQLSFTHFSYARYMQGERYMTFSVDDTWTENYFKFDVDQYLLFNNLIIPKNSKRMIIWDFQQDNELLALLRNHGYYHGISIHRRDEDWIESWHFATNSENNQINEFYLNHLVYLEKFILYFQEEARNLTNSSDKTKLAIYKNNRSLDLSKFDCENLLNPAHEQFLHSVALKKYRFNLPHKTVFLSPTEFECLRGVSQGLTAKIIALNRHISHRTVEVTLQNIKNKCDMTTKTQLVDIFRKSPYADIH